MTELPDFNEMWDYAKPEETRAKFERVLEENSKKAPLNYVLELKTQIARTYGLQAQFEQSHKVLDDVDNQLNENTKMAKVRYYLERGRAYNSAGEKVKAKDLFISAYELARQIHARLYTIDAAHMVAIATADFEEKMDWSQRGLEEAKNAEEPRARNWQGVFLNNMGWDYFERENYNRSLELFEQCAAFYKSIGNSERQMIAEWSFAKTLRMTGDTERALQMQLKILDRKGGEDKGGFGYEELGELYLIKEDHEMAKTHFAKAYEILSKDVWLQRNEPQRLERMRSIIEK